MQTDIYFYFFPANRRQDGEKILHLDKEERVCMRVCACLHVFDIEREREREREREDVSG